MRKMRDDCITRIQPRNQAELYENVTACILATLSRQYILTLWPAFVGVIVALAPDPANMVYDNVWWAALFAITCGGLPGLHGSSSPPHHVEAHSESEGRQLCEAWKYTAARPKLMSKTESMGSKTRGSRYVLFEWMAFPLGCALWLLFCVYFGFTIGPALDFSFGAKVVRGAIWYYISCGPAALGVVFEVLQGRVDLYEPESRNEVEMSSIRGGEVVMCSTQSGALFRKVHTKSVFSLWVKIALHQWRRTKHRVLIRDASLHWFFVIGLAMVGITRVAVFALGSVTMGNILLMPVPDDLYLFIILLFTTAIPQQFWPAFWANGNRGVDLVVFVHAIQLMEMWFMEQDSS